MLFPLRICYNNIRGGAIVSKIFFPYIYHGSIAHKYYIRFDFRTSLTEPPKKFSTIFSTGIREEYGKEFEMAYIHLLDQLLLYDECMIPVEDVIYLMGTIGFENTLKILNSGGVHLYDALSNRIGMYFGPFNQVMMFADKSPESEQKLYARLESMIKPLRFKLYIKEEWKPTIIDLFRKAYFINDIFGLFKDTESETLFEYGKDEIKKLLSLTPKVESYNLEEQQVKVNRLLHFQYYKRISELLKCDYMFIPVELESLYEHYASTTEVSKDTLKGIFSHITKLERIPDIPKLINDSILSVDDILEIRESKASKNFRKWIHKLDVANSKVEDPELFAQLYHEACMSNNKFKTAYNSKEGSAIRTVGLMAIGTVNPGLGIGATIFDYLVSNGLDKFNPADYTRNKLKKIIDKKSTSTSK
jgi:hypothetical protein